MDVIETRIIASSFTIKEKMMKLLNLGCTLVLAAAVSNSQAKSEESQVNKLLSPTFVELQDEMVFNTVTTYRNIPDLIIDKAIDKHFTRIQFMEFISTSTQEENNDYR